MIVVFSKNYCMEICIHQKYFVILHHQNQKPIELRCQQDKVGDNMMTSIAINSIVRETAKAILVNVDVTFNGNAAKPREIWIPSSLVAEKSDISISLPDWFVSKIEWQNAFKGYAMRFAKSIHFED